MMTASGHGWPRSVSRSLRERGLLGSCFVFYVASERRHELMLFSRATIVGPGKEEELVYDINKMPLSEAKQRSDAWRAERKGSRSG